MPTTLPEASHAAEPAAMPAAHAAEPTARATAPLTRADLVLRAALAVMTPVARLLIANGVTYNRFAQALKQVFLDVAHDELVRGHRKVTDSALSLLSGVHRKDVRAFGSSGELRPGANRALSIASLVFTRWSTDPAWADATGTPLVLPLRARDGATTATFEALTQSVSKDFHARSVLDELLRLKLVTFDDEVVRLRPDAYAPTVEFAETLREATIGLRAHAATVAANLRNVVAGNRPALLDASIEVDGLTPEAAAQLDAVARESWQDAARRVKEAAQAVQAQSRPQDGAPAADGAAPSARSVVRFGAWLHADAETPVQKR